MTSPPVCDYEGSDYQSQFWDQGGREYEDRAEAIALKRLLPGAGRLLLEVGAGAGRNTPRYTGFDHVVLLDYSRTQLEQAYDRLGGPAQVRRDGLPRYVFVAADAYRLPFVAGRFDAATMIRALHHMADAPGVLRQVADSLRPGGSFVLEFANKLNLKAILRYAFRRQDWNPFSPEPVEFVRLNFDFHPDTVRRWLAEAGFEVRRILTVSHFRLGLLKRMLPPGLLAFFDSLLQWTGAFFQLTPSVFLAARRSSTSPAAGALSSVIELFKCPVCGHAPLLDRGDYLECPACSRRWSIRDEIYDFREPMSSAEET
jgi:ubiquinone/menaquinone biosynthesis C-methylase UbiE